MYSLTFCVRFLLPELHQRKPAVQAAAVMLRTPPVDGQSPASKPRRLPIFRAQFWERPPSPASQWPAARADPAQPAVRTAGWAGCKVQTCITMTVLLHQFPSMFRSEKCDQGVDGSPVPLSFWITQSNRPCSFFSPGTTIPADLTSYGNDLR